jgi:hypothetical protein
VNSTWIVRRLAVTACLAGSWSFVSAQAVRGRIVEDINPNNTVVLRGSVSPRIAPELKIGRMTPSTRITGITLTFALTAEQKAELDALVQAQLTPGNPEYHQWLTPAEYAARFGMSPSDVQKVETWLQSEGFSIERVANSRTSITFSGTAEQVESAFETRMNRYRVNGKEHWANATDVSIPAALQGVVLSVTSLNDFRPHPMTRPVLGGSAITRPAFTSSQSGNNYMTPGDAAIIYDIKPAYNAGFNGKGVTIAIMGQSAVTASDIQNFDSAAGLSFNNPTMILVPGSGTSTTYQGDESESDLDLEYSGAIANGATIDFVYTGSSPNDNVFNSLQYAVDERIGSVISISYGACETGISSTQFSSLEQTMQQGAVQGQTIVASSGDSGSTSCYGYTNLTSAQQQALAVNYPASSEYVTGVGGTEFPSADANAGTGTGSNSSQYWQPASGTDVVTSALKYIPETTWNDDVTCGHSATTTNNPGGALCSGGGGASALASRPSWQTGVPGIASGSTRLVPDVSLDSSNVVAPYLFCTSDQSAWQPGGNGTAAQAASCNNGFRDSTSLDLTAAGGTSFAAPIFAGMMAVLDQETNSSQGLVAAELYKLASSGSTYSSVFHDITTGGNNCTAGSSYCSGSAVNDYAATTGYDEATGLGSIDFDNLMQAWPAATTSLLTTTTALAASPNVSAGSTDLITIQVASPSGTPTGSVTISDGTETQTSSQIGTATLTAGAATFSYSPTSTTYNGAHVLVVTYTGDSNFAGSSAAVSITVAGGTAPPGFALSPSPATVSVSAGSSATTTLNIASQNAYSGTVSISYAVTSSNANSFYTNGCLGLSGSSTNSTNGDITVPTGGTTTTVTFYTSSSQCSSTSGTGGMRPGFYRIRPVGVSGWQAHNRSPFGGAIPIGASAMAGLLLFGFRRQRSKLWTMLGCLMLAVALGGFATGCGGSSGGGVGGKFGGGGGGTGGGANVAAGTYSFVLFGSDTTNGAITAQTNVTLTVN